jgi:hypothetical protein
MITQERLKEIFEYKDGALYWKKPNVKANRIKIGDRFGANDNGYRRGGIDGTNYLEHRLIFMMHHGFVPKYIDHIDNDTTNNHIENLRECTNGENQHNRILGKANTSGIKGVTWHSPTKKWQVRLGIGWKSKYFGTYYDINVAKFVAEIMRHKYHKEFANNG